MSSLELSGLLNNTISEHELVSSVLTTQDKSHAVESGLSELDELDTTVTTLESISNILKSSYNQLSVESIALVNANLHSYEKMYSLPATSLTVGMEDGNVDDTVSKQSSKLSMLLSSVKSAIIDGITRVASILDGLFKSVKKQLTGIKEQALKIKETINRENNGGKMITLSTRTRNTLASVNGITGSEFVNKFRITTELFNSVVDNYYTNDGLNEFLEYAKNSMKSAKPDGNSVNKLIKMNSGLDKLLNHSKTVTDSDITFGSKPLYGFTKQKTASVALVKKQMTKEKVMNDFRLIIEAYSEAQKQQNDEPSMEHFVVSMEESKLKKLLTGSIQGYLAGLVVYYGVVNVLPLTVSASASLFTTLAASNVVMAGVVSGLAVIGVAVALFIIARILVLRAANDFKYALEDNSGELNKLVDFIIEFNSRYELVEISEQQKDVTTSLSASEIEMTTDNVVSLCDKMIGICNSIKDRNNAIKEFSKSLKNTGGSEYETAAYSLLNDELIKKVKKYIKFENNFLTSMSGVLYSGLEYVNTSNGS